MAQARVVVVTGASAGVGRATARAFAEPGARIALLARNRERLETAAREVEALGARALVLETDVADPSQVERAAARVEETFGPPDVWVNNAMTSVFGPVRETTPEEYRRVTEVTYLGTVYGTLAALRRMTPRNRGAIVQVGSALAYRGIPLQSAYCAAKHAIQGFCDSLRAELLHEGSRITLSMVQLPAINTPQFDWVRSHLSHRAQPVPPIFQPEVAAQAVRFAASSGRREIYVGGSAFEAIVANKWMPGLLDRWLARTGFASQQTDEPEDPTRADNLWQDVPGDYGAHGRFDDRARSWSAQLWATEHRAGLALVGLGAALAASALGWRRARG